MEKKYKTISSQKHFAAKDHEAALTCTPACQYWNDEVLTHEGGSKNKKRSTAKKPS